jgi:hypothetical protein
LTIPQVKKTNIKKMSVTPPTTPPAMGPALDFFEDVAVGFGVAETGVPVKSG